MRRRHARSTCEGDATSHTGTATRFRGGTKAKPSSTTHEGKAASTKECTSRRGEPRCDGNTEYFISKSTPASRHTARRAGLHERFPPSSQSFIRRQRHLRGRRLRGEGGTSQSTPCTVDEHSTASPPRGSIVVTSRLDSNTTTNGEGAQRTARLYQRQRQYTPASGNPPPYPKTILLIDEIGAPNVNFASGMEGRRNSNEEDTSTGRTSETRLNSTAPTTWFTTAHPKVMTSPNHTTNSTKTVTSRASDVSIPPTTCL